MEDLRETCVRLHEQGQPWLKREEEFVGVVLWAVGITTLAFLPDTGTFTRMVKKLMRLHARSISAARPAVHDTESSLHALCFG